MPERFTRSRRSRSPVALLTPCEFFRCTRNQNGSGVSIAAEPRPLEAVAAGGNVQVRSDRSGGKGRIGPARGPWVALPNCDIMFVSKLQATLRERSLNAGACWFRLEVAAASRAWTTRRQWRPRLVRAGAAGVLAGLPAGAAELGSHDELMARDGVYAALFQAPGARPIPIRPIAVHPTSTVKTNLSEVAGTRR